MSTAIMPPANGRAMPRRTLNDSIARLDDILDGLGEAIPATIQDALRQSVGAAVAEGVKAAIVEIMTNPELFAKMPAAVPVREAVAVPLSLLGRIGDAVVGALNRVRKWAAPQVASLRDSTKEAVGRAKQTGGGLVHRLIWLSKCRRAIGLSAIVGSVLAAVAYLSPPTFAGIVAGVAGTVSALGVQFALWVRRGFGRLMPL